MADADNKAPAQPECAEGPVVEGSERAEDQASERAERAGEAAPRAVAFAAEFAFDVRAADVAARAVSLPVSVLSGAVAFLAGAVLAILFGLGEDSYIVGIVCLAFGLVLGPVAGCSVFFLVRRSARSLAQPGTRFGIRVEGERLCMYLTRGGAPISTVWREIASLYALERRRGYILIYLAKNQVNILAEDAFTVGDAGGFCAFCAAFGVHVR